VSHRFVERLILIQTLPCMADPSRCVVVGRPDRSLAEVLPFINAVLPNVISYASSAGVMTLRRQPGFITIYPDRVYITQVQDPAEGMAMLDALADLLNKIWSHRGEIAPAAGPRRGPRLLDVWKLLPRSNCKRCGLPTCMAFAVGMLLGTATLPACTPLAEPAAAGQRAALAAMLNVEEQRDSGAGPGQGDT
jgi:ArsR family metal-binding transcriptional regulator